MIFGLGNNSNRQPGSQNSTGNSTSFMPGLFDLPVGPDQIEPRSRRSPRNHRERGSQQKCRVEGQQPRLQTQPQTRQQACMQQRHPSQNQKKQPQSRLDQTEQKNECLYFRQKGNQFYKAGNFEAAILAYNKAIQINGNQSALYSNRSKCHKNLGRLDQGLQDIQIAIDLDDTNVKAYLIQGQLLAEKGKNEQSNDRIELAISKMVKALNLCTTMNKPQFKKDVGTYIHRAKKLLWLKNYQKDKATKLKLLQTFSQFTKTKSQNQAKLKLKELHRIIVPDCTFQIPERLCCKITYQLMKDPVTTQAGHTYQRSAIECHMRQNGHTDPFTRQGISSTLYPNHLVKELIEDFTSKNPWTYQFVAGEDYKKIKF